MRQVLFFIPISQMRKLRLREVKSYAKDYRACKGRAGFRTDKSTSKCKANALLFLPPKLYVFILYSGVLENRNNVWPIFVSLCSTPNCRSTYEDTWGAGVACLESSRKTWVYVSYELYELMGFSCAYMTEHSGAVLPRIFG